MNVVNDQVMGLGGVVVPGTLRNSLFILDAIHARDGGPKPETVITDTASYCDIVFGLFAICGYQFSPRIADISDARLWRTNTAADYGPLQAVSNHTIRLDRIRAHWDDMLRVAGSLTLGKVRGHDLIRMLSRDGKPTGLGDAFAHYRRIFKTLHLLQFVSDEGYRRMIGAQLNVTEARHRLARKIFFGQRGELLQHYREGMEDQLGALGLALNAVVLFNSLYLDAAVKQLAADGFPVTDELLARLSPLQYDHINLLGRHAFTRPPMPGLRRLRDPHIDDETDDGEDAQLRARTVEGGPDPESPPMTPGPDRLGYEAQSGRRVSTGQTMLNRSGTCQGADRLAGCRLAQPLRGGRGPLRESARLDAGALDRLGELGVESLPADLMPGG
ncbi:TnpA family transposase [Streptomyces turgidiscabies]|uniref:TnpA family transposase n=1 Tax=Streptomyces turgidiscabies TaxID=85558 RepID=A0ABU0S0H9_9ACTN|nr:TnpA family transposase [Streptomyces turgidiscabies]